VRKSANMKVHPGMGMKTNGGRFQVSGAGCQGGTGNKLQSPLDTALREKCENEGSSGDIEENKQKQVSRVRCPVVGAHRRLRFSSQGRGLAARESTKMTGPRQSPRSSPKGNKIISRR
jgi:hypothetical protein